MELASQPHANDLTFDELRSTLRKFAADRDWNKYHTPRNLVMALVGEVGELAECFQWKGEVHQGLPEFSDDERTHVAEELSDLRSLERSSKMHASIQLIWSEGQRPSTLTTKLNKDRPAHQMLRHDTNRQHKASQGRLHCFSTTSSPALQISSESGAPRLCRGLPPPPAVTVMMVLHWLP
eukprot:362866-Chlamydomonas_euryale.AAC.23